MADLSALRERMTARYAAVGDDAARDMEIALQDAAPFASGETRTLTHVDATNSAPPILSWRAHSDTPQAEWTNTGTQPHVIRPIRASRLVFPGSDGLLVFAKEVNHPGFVGTHWFDLTVAGWQAALQGALDRAGAL